MSIKIISQLELETLQTNAIIRKTPEILTPQLKSLFTQRLNRLEQLKMHSDFSDYHQFCFAMTQAQEKITTELPFKPNQAIAPARYFAEEQTAILKWAIEIYLPRLIEALSQNEALLTDEIRATFTQLLQMSAFEKQEKARLLWQKEFDKVNANEALFLWHSMMMVYRQIAAQLKIKALAEFGGHRFLCPLCHSNPVASVIQKGQEQGLRYLHCSLCETQWHVPRVQCTYCDNLEGIELVSCEALNPNVKAETCPKCRTYLKIIYLDVAPQLDPVIDDLETWILDREIEQLGFAKSGRNPFLF